MSDVNDVDCIVGTAAFSVGAGVVITEATPMFPASVSASPKQGEPGRHRFIQHQTGLRVVEALVGSMGEICRRVSRN
ncbi:hypothetical protein [Sinorhizobium sp. M4_45]|uniref:hypothetical protein n=1 Tax=Sinorhizobium sp. M4_45 TaxID=2037901 RepID=UPI000C9B3CFE|nr:hypothetical protein [Sinorhizobium sp. M4_45]PND24173.1 hypothetical protein CN933_28855 [Sinorhizobium sp. M4_45]